MRAGVPQPDVSSGDGNAQCVGGQGLGCTRFVEHVDVLNGEAGGLEQVEDRSRQMTASGYPLVERLEPALPAPYVLIRGQAVLEEVQGATRAQYSTDLGQGEDRVRD